MQTITGMKSDPSQSVFLDWHTNGTPALTSSDWVQANVQSNGQFSASINVDQAGLTEHDVLPYRLWASYRRMVRHASLAAADRRQFRTELDGHCPAMDLRHRQERQRI